MWRAPYTSLQSFRASCGHLRVARIFDHDPFRPGSRYRSVLAPVLARLFLIELTRLMRD